MRASANRQSRSELLRPLLLAPTPQRLRLAALTLARAVRSGVVIRMSFRAHIATPESDSNEIGAAPEIVELCDALEVVRPHARPVIALVIDNKRVGDGTAKE